MARIGLSIWIISGPTRIEGSTSIAADRGDFQWNAMTALENCERQVRAHNRSSGLLRSGHRVRLGTATRLALRDDCHVAHSCPRRPIDIPNKASA